MTLLDNSCRKISSFDFPHSQRLTRQCKRGISHVMILSSDIINANFNHFGPSFITFYLVVAQKSAYQGYRNIIRLLFVQMCVRGSSSWLYHVVSRKRNWKHLIFSFPLALIHTVLRGVSSCKVVALDLFCARNVRDHGH